MAEALQVALRVQTALRLFARLLVGEGRLPLPMQFAHYKRVRINAMPEQTLQAGIAGGVVASCEIPPETT